MKNVQIGIARKYQALRFDHDSDMISYTDIGGFATLFKSLRAYVFEHKAKAHINITYDSLRVFDKSVSWTSGTEIMRNGFNVLEVVKEHLTGKVIIYVVQERQTRHKMKVGPTKVDKIQQVRLGFTRPQDALMVKMILQ